MYQKTFLLRVFIYPTPPPALLHLFVPVRGHNCFGVIVCLVVYLLTPLCLVSAVPISSSVTLPWTLRTNGYGHWGPFLFEQNYGVLINILLCHSVYSDYVLLWWPRRCQSMMCTGKDSESLHTLSPRSLLLIVYALFTCTRRCSRG